MDLFPGRPGLGPSTKVDTRILTITWRMRGKWLAFDGRGTYNPATGKKGAPLSFLAGCPFLRPCQEARHSRAGSRAVQAECSHCCGKRYVSRIVISRRS